MAVSIKYSSMLSLVIIQCFLSILAIMPRTFALCSCKSFNNSTIRSASPASAVSMKSERSQTASVGTAGNGGTSTLRRGKRLSLHCLCSSASTQGVAYSITLANVIGPTARNAARFRFRRSLSNQTLIVVDPARFIWHGKRTSDNCPH